MRFVELNERFRGQGRPVVVALAETPQNILQRAGDKEVLLTQAQFFARKHIVVRIEDFGQVFGEHLVFHRVDIRPFVEIIEVELVIGFG